MMIEITWSGKEYYHTAGHKFDWNGDERHVWGKCVYCGLSYYEYVKILHPWWNPDKIKKTPRGPEYCSKGSK